MKLRFHTRLAAWICSAIALGSSGAFAAGIPVIDASNLSQQTINTISTLTQEVQQVEQYATQINQYQTQLQQYQNMLQNTQVPNLWILQDTVRVLNNTRNLFANVSMGNIGQYLKNYVAPQFYQTNPCLTGGTCTPQAWTQLINSNQQLTQDRIDRLNTWFDQQSSLDSKLKESDEQFDRIKAQAQTAQGQLQAIGYTNMLLAQLADINMQTRDLLLEMIRNEKAKELAAEAQHQAIGNALRVRSDPYDMSPARQVYVNLGR